MKHLSVGLEVQTIVRDCIEGSEKSSKRCNPPHCFFRHFKRNTVGFPFVAYRLPPFNQPFLGFITPGHLLHELQALPPRGAPSSDSTEVSVHTRIMWDSQHKPRSDNPNAPNIPYHLYFDEKTDFSGALVASILYGTSKAPHHKFNYPCSFRVFGLF